MTFLQALQHAMIGYGIKRKGWDDSICIVWNYEKTQLQMMTNGKPAWIIHFPNTDITIADLHAEDWDII